jgi:hypothetical protein
LATEVEAQLSKLPAELPSEGHVEMHTPIGEQVDIPFRLTEQIIGEREEPRLDLIFHLDCTPRHSGNAMPRVVELDIGFVIRNVPVRWTSVDPMFFQQRESQLGRTPSPVT